MKLFMPHFPPENKTTTQPKPKQNKQMNNNNKAKGTQKKNMKKKKMLNVHSTYIDRNREGFAKYQVQ